MADGITQRGRVPREARELIAGALAAEQDGVVHRRDLRAAGISRDDVRSEVRAGRWSVVGRHTVAIGPAPSSGPARWRLAVWESGSGAALDGAAALVAAGLRGYTPTVIDVALPRNNRAYPMDGVRLRYSRQVGPVVEVGIRRIAVEEALIHAARWARTDREAALLVCLVIQQRLTSAPRLRAAWQRSGRGRRGRFIGRIIADVCAGAESLGELDFGRMCRRYRLPEPSRQVVGRGPNGRIYLDVFWREVGLAVEIDGGHHAWALNPVDDALRQNEVALQGAVVLRIPVVGLRLHEQRFMAQVVTAYRLLESRRAS